MQFFNLFFQTKLIFNIYQEFLDFKEQQHTAETTMCKCYM